MTRAVLETRIIPKPIRAAHRLRSGRKLEGKAPFPEALDHRWPTVEVDLLVEEHSGGAKVRGVVLGIIAAAEIHVVACLATKVDLDVVELVLVLVMQDDFAGDFVAVCVDVVGFEQDLDDGGVFDAAKG